MHPDSSGARISFGAGQFIVNSFPILEHIDKHPVADPIAGST